MALALLLSACGHGSIIVSHAYQVEAMLRDESGRVVEEGEVVTVPRPPRMALPFDWHEYRGRDFEMSIGAATGHIVNRSDETLCARFDEARMRSSAHPEPVRLWVSTWTMLKDGKWRQLEYLGRLPTEYFVPPPLCMGPREERFFGYSPDLRELFPTGRRFDVRLQGNEPILLDKGIGRWLATSLPMEIGARRTVLELKQTVLDSAARISYY